MNRPLVIMVDDEPALRTVYQKFLGKRCEVRTFADGQSFLDALPTLAPATFVLDWMLPDLNGIELCRLIRQERRFDMVPIAFLTAMRPSIENMQQVFDAGGQIFIEKTGSPATIISQIFAQVDAFERWQRNAGLDVTVMSFLRHDLMGYLTGAITGTEVMALHPAFDDPELHQQLDSVLQSGVAIRELVEDMGVVLRPRDFPAKTLGESIDATGVRDYVQGRLDIKSMRVDFAEPQAEGTIPMLAARLLYYLSTLLRYRYALSNTIRIGLAQAGPDTWEASVRVSVRGAEDLKETLFGPLSHEAGGHPEEALPIQFVSRALALLDSTMTFTEDGTGCTLAFPIPCQPPVA